MTNVGVYVAPAAPLTPARRRAALAWARDCTWLEDPDQLEQLTDRQIVEGVSRHYAGGWGGFLRDGDPT